MPLLESLGETLDIGAMCDGYGTNKTNMETTDPIADEMTDKAETSAAASNGPMVLIVLMLIIAMADTGKQDNHRTQHRQGSSSKWCPNRQQTKLDKQQHATRQSAFYSCRGLGSTLSVGVSDVSSRSGDTTGAMQRNNSLNSNAEPCGDYSPIPAGQEVEIQSYDKEMRLQTNKNNL